MLPYNQKGINNRYTNRTNKKFADTILICLNVILAVGEKKISTLILMRCKLNQLNHALFDSILAHDNK